MVRIRCSRCHGRGTVELNGAYFDTLKRLVALEPINGADLARNMGVGHTAMCNRLVNLRRLGLVNCKRYGREGD
jgi:hypothetical protein